MAVRPDPEVGYRRAGDHLRAERLVERRVFVQAPPRVGLGGPPRPGRFGGLFPELRLGPAVPSWPAAATTRTARARLGLLREEARVESLEARRSRSSGCGSPASGFESEWSWRLEPVAGGTRVIHAATFEPIDRWTGILVRLGRARSRGAGRGALRALKDRAEATGRRLTGAVGDRLRMVRVPSAGRADSRDAGYRSAWTRSSSRS